MAPFHNSVAGEKLALKTHSALKWASFGSALFSLAVFGMSVASILWHSKGQADHLANLRKLEGESKDGTGHFI